MLRSLIFASKRMTCRNIIYVLMPSLKRKWIRMHTSDFKTERCLSCNFIKCFLLFIITICYVKREANCRAYIIYAAPCLITPDIWPNEAKETVLLMWCHNCIMEVLENVKNHQITQLLVLGQVLRIQYWHSKFSVRLSLKSIEVLRLWPQMKLLD